MVQAQEDRQGCADNPLLSRMSGFFIERCREEAFARHEFQVSGKKVPKEGHLSFLEYRMPRDAAKRSNLEIIRNYTNAISTIGGEVTYEGRYSASMKVVTDGREIWVEVLPAAGRSYQLYVVEQQAMAQQVVADAAALLDSLDRVGHTVLKGILFDTDKAVIKPESRKALEEIAKLLRENPGVAAFIVGHTDTSGSFEHNMDLSGRRAAAVVEALVSDFGISVDRLTPRGVGPLAPIGSNDTEAGRALNRRVEMVKR
jgi:outer membrane protein OmpA-like peptidoglycan-associated protein